MVEQGTFNPKVAGSIPARPIKTACNRADLALGVETGVVWWAQMLGI